MLNLIRQSPAYLTRGKLCAGRVATYSLVQMLAIACLLLLLTVGAMANTGPPGGSGTFPPASTAAVYSNWAIYDPSHTLIATGSLPSPGPNGWNGSFTWQLINGVATITSIIVSAPPTAVNGFGYSIEVAGPNGNNTVFFSVLAGGFGVNSLIISPTSIYGGDTATGAVSITSIAPAGGISVSCASSSTDPHNYAAVSPTVTIPQGRSMTTFGIPTLGSTFATITATSAGQSRSGGISVSSSPASGGTVRIG